MPYFNTNHRKLKVEKEIIPFPLVYSKTTNYFSLFSEFFINILDIKQTLRFRIIIVSIMGMAFW